MCVVLCFCEGCGFVCDCDVFLLGEVMIEFW